jgi:hypothetical protein
MQTKAGSMVEAVTNTVIGCVLDFAIAFAVASAAAWIVTLMVPISAARQYVIRRLFNKGNA